MFEKILRLFGGGSKEETAKKNELVGNDGEKKDGGEVVVKEAVVRDELPKFKYHPDPIATGSIEASEDKCACCGMRRGYLCVVGYFGQGDEEFMCPWCISDGTARRKLHNNLFDEWTLQKAGISKEIIDEVHQRTVPYESWQTPEWQACCGDACEYHGTPEREDLEKLSFEEGQELYYDCFEDEADWREHVAEFDKETMHGGVYKFVCKHCGKVLMYYDCD
ncbi:CbrC family protein [Planctomycetota bacterium]|nr:CbrC family protein [Planctomycetota bacterium]